MEASQQPSPATRHRLPPTITSLSPAARHRLPPNHHLPLAATASTHDIKHATTNSLHADDNRLSKTIPREDDVRTQSAMYGRHFCAANIAMSKTVQTADVENIHVPDNI